MTSPVMVVLSRVMYVVDNYSVYKRYGSEFDPHEDDVMSNYFYFFALDSFLSLNYAMEHIMS